MKKEYTTPDVTIVEFETEDILDMSEITVEKNQPKTFDNATALAEQTIDVFN